MNPKDKAALGMAQGILMAIVGVLIALYPNAFLRALPEWFGWILFFIGLIGFIFYLLRYRRVRTPWL